MKLPATEDRALVWVFVPMIISFWLAAVLSQVLASRIDAAADRLVFDSAPSIEHLAAARAEVRLLEYRADQYVRERAAGGDPGRARVEASLRALNSETDAYLGLPLFSGEQGHWAEVRGDLDDLLGAIHRAMAEADLGAFARAEATLDAGVHPAADRTGAALLSAIDFHGRNTAALARDIQRTRVQTTLALGGLQAFATAIAVLAAVLLRRSLQRERALAADRSRLIGERVEDLDLFAGRVAHDVMSPLGATATALEIIRRTSGEARTTGLAGRALTSLQRSRTIVDDLLEFTRAGARPDPEVHTEVAPVIAGVVGELAFAAAEARVLLEVEPVPPFACACSEGVLTSLVTNLVRNAIKHMGDAPERRVVVRAADAGGCVRIEVEDTGPGLPPALVDHVFLPFVRAPGGSAVPGIGLGLATVKRLAEAHGGRVGVRSRSGAGSTFWFELPRVASTSVHPAAAGAEPEPVAKH